MKQVVALPSEDIPTTRSADHLQYLDKDELVDPRIGAHLVGMITLMELQGPGQFAQPVRHDLFTQVRYMWVRGLRRICPSLRDLTVLQIFWCLRSRKATFLGSREWIVEPFSGWMKCYWDTILDAIAPLPAILEGYDTLQIAPPGHDAKERASNLKKQCFAVKAGLDRWHDVLSNTCPSFSTEEARSLRKHLDTLEPEELPDVFAEYSAWYLIAWMVYWSACLTLYRTTHLIYLHFPPTATEQIVVAPATSGTYCLSIARSVKHFLHPENSGMLAEIAMRAPLFFAKKAMFDSDLAAAGDAKFAEAKMILESIGSGDLELVMAESR